MRDAKNLHEELLIRESYSWRNGWAGRAELMILGGIWGAAVVVALLVFWP